MISRAFRNWYQFLRGSTYRKGVAFVWHCLRKPQIPRRGLRWRASLGALMIGLCSASRTEICQVRILETVEKPQRVLKRRNTGHKGGPFQGGSPEEECSTKAAVMR